MFFLRTFSPEALKEDSRLVVESLRHMQCLNMHHAINPVMARDGVEALRAFMEDEDVLARYPYSYERRFGYSPEGSETNPRSSRTPNQTRRMFDFTAEFQQMLEQLPILELFRTIVSLARFSLDRIDHAFGSQLAKLPHGDHSLRAARYLVEATPNDVLYPPHKDFSVVTVFIGTGEPGLEIKVGERWCPVYSEPGTALVGIGKPALEFVSDDLDWEPQALEHRVVGGAKNRLSAFLFYEFDRDVWLPKSQETYGAMLDRNMSRIRADAAA